jgi:opacity protein-like surface antigen
MRRVRLTILTLTACVMCSTPAWADATLFLGATTTPDNRQARGVAVGAGLLVLGFEFEYSSTAEDVRGGAPSLKVGSGNGLVQTPVPIFGLQPYLTVGGGIFRERLGTSTETNFASNVGGGVKVALAGPLRLRVDYRAFKLGGSARQSPSHRLYAGLNLKF